MSFAQILKGGVGSGRHAYNGNPLTAQVNRSSFRDVPIGEHFHTGKGKGVGANSDKAQMTVYQKTSPSKAVIAHRIGFGNTSMEGSEIGFNHTQPVFHLQTS